MLDDIVTGPQQLHFHMHPKILTSSPKRLNRLSVTSKNFSKYRNLTKKLRKGIGKKYIKNNGMLFQRLFCNTIFIAS